MFESLRTNTSLKKSFYKAVGRADYRYVDTLFAAGLKITQEEKDAAFRTALNKGAKKTAEVLLFNGANPRTNKKLDMSGINPLGRAIAMNAVFMAEEMIETYDMDVNERQAYKTTHLMLAAEGNKLEMVSLLLNYSADVWARDDAKKLAINHIDKEACDQSSMEGIKLILRQKMRDEAKKMKAAGFKSVKEWQKPKAVFRGGA